MSAAALVVGHVPSAIRSELPAGVLHLELQGGRQAFGSLLDFAARANPKRAFLFLSKVLGKHYPSIPSEMMSVHRQLAATVPDGAGPVVFIGMAETATGLGQGVFEAWADAHPGSHALYLQSTRYKVRGAERLGFDESHSHAPRLFLHLPRREADQGALAGARQVVLVDDELSTGNTFVNLVSVLRRVMPALSRVHIATIADFTGDRRALLSERMDSPCTIGALLCGSWRFEYHQDAAPGALVAGGSAQCSAGHEVLIEDTGYGRLGCTSAVSVPGALVERLSSEPVEGTTLVLGTGEFMHAAFALGRALELRGVDVRVQSTTRSPILLWGAIGHALAVPDPYGEGIQNYLYNVRPGQYARVLICHEIAPNDRLMELAAMLHARLIHFTQDDHVEEIPVC